LGLISELCFTEAAQKKREIAEAAHRPEKSLEQRKREYEDRQRQIVAVYAFIFAGSLFAILPFIFSEFQRGNPSYSSAF
jgi:hypothetical protein